MTISEPSQATLFQDGEGATSSRAGSRASRSVQPGSDEARRITATSGLKCSASLTKCDRATSWVRTLLTSQRWHSKRRVLTWKVSAMKSGRLLFRLYPLGPFTSDPGYGLWPTMQASDCRDRGNMSNPSIQRRKRMGKQLNLSMVIKDSPGQMNPVWAELFMGYPTTWTDLRDSETP